ncbi:MAG: cytochrome C oxidase Cbb3, partial [Gammaproteobacteria bacterium]
MQGGIGPELVADNYDEETLFRIIYDGIAEGGMPSYANLGTERVWQLVNL